MSRTLRQNHITEGAVPLGMPGSADELSYLEKKVLQTLGKLKKASPEELKAAGKFRELVEVMNAASWLQAKGLVTMKERVVHSFRLASPAAGRKALPERKALRALIKAHGKMSVPKLQAAGKFDDGELAVALGWLRRKGWADVAKTPEGSVVSVTPEGREAAGSKGADELLLARLAKGELPEDAIDPRVLRDLKSRRELVKERESVRREIALTPAGERILAAGLTLKEDVAQPTTELLRSGRWRQVDFRRYDTKAFAPLVRPGKRHVLGAYIERIRRIFLSMGFTEIDGDFVQSAFWNFDALFQPQDNPARAQLDTFYQRLGFTRVKFRPGYFPYTEPSMEPEGQTSDGRWMELGGSGIFRPEVTVPLGIDSPVLAWGLGLERLVMTIEGLSDIRQLYLSDLDWLRDHRAIL